MPSLNKVFLIGICGRDPDVSETKTGTVANCSIATNYEIKGSDGTKTEQVTWHRLVFFGKLAEIVGKYVRRGTLLHVEGRIHQNEYIDKTGNKVKSTDIIVSAVQMLSKKESAQPIKQYEPISSRFDDGEDIPF